MENTNGSYSSDSSSDEIGDVTIKELMYMLCRNDRMKYLIDISNNVINIEKYYDIVKNSKICNVTVRSFGEYQSKFHYILQALSDQLNEQEIINIIKYKAYLDVIILEIFENLI